MRWTRSCRTSTASKSSFSGSRDLIWYFKIGVEEIVAQSERDLYKRIKEIWQSARKVPSSHFEKVRFYLIYLVAVFGPPSSIVSFD
jgi:hypothetical protein